jgi:hypothetical protein
MSVTVDHMRNRKGGDAFNSFDLNAEEENQSVSETGKEEVSNQERPTIFSPIVGGASTTTTLSVVTKKRA